MIRYKGEHDQLVGIRLSANVSPRVFDKAYDTCSDYFHGTEIVKEDESVLLRSELAWPHHRDSLTAEKT